MLQGRPGRIVRTRIWRYGATRTGKKSDHLAAEEPLEIRVLPAGADRPLSISVTMRTPGEDFELAVGFLASEGLLRRPADLEHVRYCAGPEEPHQFNVVQVNLKAGATFDPDRFRRNFYASSSCGLCGKASIDAVEVVCSEHPQGASRLTPESLLRLPERLRQHQPVFEKTGGLHACALFDGTGEPPLMREDIGRHNALDKLIGRLFLDRRLPASDTVLLLSGRVGFELMQKAAAAGIPVVAALGAPSSLAVSTAERFGMTLIGFLRANSFNVYSGDHRIERSTGS